MSDLLKLLTYSEMTEAFATLRRAEALLSDKEGAVNTANALAGLRSLMAVRASDFQKENIAYDRETGEVFTKSATDGASAPGGPFIVVNKTSSKGPGNTIRRTYYTSIGDAVARAARIIEAATNERKPAPTILVCEVKEVVRAAPPPVVREPGIRALDVTLGYDEEE